MRLIPLKDVEERPENTTDADAERRRFSTRMSTSSPLRYPPQSLGHLLPKRECDDC